MDDDSPPDARFSSESTTVNHGSAPYAGAFFSKSLDFTVSGSTLTTVIHNHINLDVPSDFRRIPFGDINLKHEIRLCNQSGLVEHYQVRGSVRRIYSARIFGDNSDMTAAMYQGEGAEEEWREHIAKYSRLRHPNVLQIFAVASSVDMYAIVAHDDLIPFYDFLRPYCKSPMLTVYIHGCWDKEYYEVNRYFKHEFGYYPSRNSSTFWIHHSTGRLCVDLTPGDVAAPDFFSHEWRPPFDHIPPLNDPNSEAIVIDSLELGEYHEVVYWDLGDWRTFLVSTQAELHLGAVVYSPSGSELDSSVEIALLPETNPHIGSWSGSKAVGDTMEDGWTRYNSAEIFGTTISSMIHSGYDDRMAWISQANHIFHQRQIKSNSEDYAIIVIIYFWLKISERTRTPPNGYLFVCPIEDLRTGPTSFRWPDCPAYWSLVPSGAEHLSTDEATLLGFPSIDLQTEVWTKHWDASVYAGLRKFHVGKVFDPDSQDIARNFGEPLFQILHEMEPPFAHVDDAEISEVETEREGSSTATAEDEDDDGDGSIPEHKCISDPQQLSSLDSAESAPQSWTWKAVMCVKLGLILALTFGSLYEYGRPALSQ